jgi:hypothetical protein
VSLLHEAARGLCSRELSCSRGACCVDDCVLLCVVCVVACARAWGGAFLGSVFGLNAALSWLAGCARWLAGYRKQVDTNIWYWHDWLQVACLSRFVHAAYSAAWHICETGIVAPGFMVCTCGCFLLSLKLYGHRHAVKSHAYWHDFATNFISSPGNNLSCLFWSCNVQASIAAAISTYR